jgi:hypothetical protein
MTDDPAEEERRWKQREGNFAGMVAGLLFMVLMASAVLFMFLLAPSIQMTVPTPKPNQEQFTAE